MRDRAKIPSWLFQYAMMLGILASLCGIFATLTDSFWSVSTLILIANQIPALTLIAVGMTFVLIIGGIDLSVGSMMALSSAVIGVLMIDGKVPVYLAIPVAMLVASFAGCINGSISVLARIPPFIVTLGMLEIARGCTYLLTNSQTKFIGSRIEWISTPLQGTVSPAFLIAVLVVAVAQFILVATATGRYYLAIGANPSAARMSGIRTAPYQISVYVLLGVLCSLAGWMETARLSSVDPNGSIGMELLAIAACVIGGTSLMGGKGSIINTFFGVLIMQVLQTGLTKMGAEEPSKRIVTGCVIVLAVLLEAIRSGLFSSWVERFKKSLNRQKQ